MRSRPASPIRDLVLVGGGHAHVQVLKAFAMEPLPEDVRLTLVVDTPIAVYSGMVPGFVAGQYTDAELEIDVVPLARRAGARVILARCVGVDSVARRLLLEGRPPLRYDVAAFDIGSTVAGLGTPGVRKHAVPTRPIGRLVSKIGAAIEGLARLESPRGVPGESPGKSRAVDESSNGKGDGPLRIGVVGAGAGGVELAFTLDRRLREVQARPVETTLVQRDEEILPSYPGSLRRRVLGEARKRGIRVRTGATVAAVDADGLELVSGERIPCDWPVWVVGAAPHGVLGETGLPVDERGFVRTRTTLQVEGHDDLFATGDCASLIDYPRTPKAGVYAVRQGPYLTRNLRAWLAGEPLASYRPQSDFLTLLNLGDARALGSKWGLSFGGRWVFRLKDHIDRKFMRRFQVLDGAGGETEEFAGGMAAGDDADAPPMLCGGCAAKVGQAPLAAALAAMPEPAVDPTVELGLAAADDVAAWRHASGDRIVSSVDVLRAFTDDPYLVGQVAAANAVSDLWAKGVAPRYAQAVVTVPEDLDADAQAEALEQVLLGLREVLDGGGVTLLGGHTTTGPVLQAGLHVEGVVGPETHLLALDRARAGDALVLTKALGTGVVFHADMQGRARGPWLQAVLAVMSRTNEAAARAALEAGAAAATDVTGFGLVGHLGAMMRASGTTARLELARVPALPGALELLAAGLRSTSHEENARALRGIVVSASTAGDGLALIVDPQTSGGLVIAVDEARAEGLVEELRTGGDADASVVGVVTPARRDEASIEVV